ncbi:DUF2782 domain-containing protein [Frateuria defendens]|uniref:DUF2782 domain-containing protein n=1 Tax=Frateuria defendens TaxID=2219559 RepID=UPI00066FE293|nr:DUF2782 domain-containing protein [Frateuria defendens]
MKAAVLLAASVLLAPAVFAQSAPAPVPPPPGLNDPGVKAKAASAPAPAASKLPALPAMRDNGPRDANGAAPPQVRVYQRDQDTVQEYSRNGQVYMVVVTPKSGVPQTYTLDPSGRLVDEHGQRPVRPVMYKVLEWGKSRPAEASTSGD